MGYVLFTRIRRKVRLKWYFPTSPPFSPPSLSLHTKGSLWEVLFEEKICSHHIDKSCPRKTCQPTARSYI